MIPLWQFAIPFGLALLAMVLGGRIQRQPTGPRKAAFVSLALLCAAATFGTLGAILLWNVHHSAKLSAEGTLTNLHVSWGRHNNHSNFAISQPGDTRVYVQADYTGSRLVNGQSVRVRYLDPMGTLTDLQVLSGPNTGWTLHEGDGSGGAIIALVIGGLILLVAVWLRRRTPQL